MSGVEMTDAEVIAKVQEILTPQAWIQGTWCVLPGDTAQGCGQFKGVTITNTTPVTQMCLDGALRLAIWKSFELDAGVLSPLSLDDAKLSQYNRITRLLTNLIERHYGRWLDPKSANAQSEDGSWQHTPETFNDTHTYEDVCHLLKYAAEELG